MSVQKIRIRGMRQADLPALESSALLDHSATYFIGAATRGTTEVHDITLGENDLVEFVFADNTRWMSSAEDVKEIFPVQAEKRGDDDVFELPATLSADIRNRGLLGDIALKALKIFNKKERDAAVKDRVRQYAEKLQQEQLGKLSGLYRLDAGFRLQPYAAQQSRQAFLLFLHGTASSTQSSFGALMGSNAWDFICKSYEGNVLAFQHETLTKSPLQNVHELLPRLPDNCELHLVSHSRGGLVGDVLSRFCVSDDNNKGFSETEKELLRKHGRNEDLEHIAAITELVLQKNIKVTKFVRVACPASGTTIASRRLDYFFNIVMNLVGLAFGSVANPLYTAFKDLLAAVVDCKDDLGVLPGLEAMNPDSPFIKVLNNPAPAMTVDGQLMVISGNSRINFSFKSLVIIATKLFFSSSNDLGVNTASMYQGARRTKPVQYFLDEEGVVDHFHYFSNKRTSDALLQALKSTDDHLLPGFSYLQQQAEQEALRNALLNLEGGQVFKNTVSGKRPIVVLLPGIMGSNLSHDGQLIWINYFRFIGGRLSDLHFDEANNKKVTAPSLIKTSYRDLAEHLSDTYDVVTFPFDWRRQLNECAALLHDKLRELMQYGQPIKLVGHSMGGVLVRDFIVNYNDTWQKLNSSAGFRLLFLGSPLGGSFRIPYVLYGFDDIISKIAKIDLHHTKKELLEIFCNLPGLLSLLPLTTDKDNDFAKTETWEAMSRHTGDTGWPIPSAEALAEFGRYRDRIIAKANDIDWSNAVYIAGKDLATPAAYTLKNGKLEFLHTAAGDQSVTWDSGIPQKMIGNNTVYYANVTHGGLSCAASLFGPISEILSKGYTNMLVRSRPQLRSAELEFAAPPSENFDCSPQGLEQTLLGLGQVADAAAVTVPLKVSVSNGDLRFARFPILVGHFKKDAILNAEKAIDSNLKGSLSELHRLDLYPGDIGTSEMILLQKGPFKGTVIVGLGEQGALTAFQLAQTTEQAIAKYLVAINNPVNGSYTTGDIGVSTLLIGCGYGGLSIENATRALLQGIQNANNKMKLLRPEDARLVASVEFVEVYEDKALSCLYTLNKIAQESSQALNISLEERNIKPLMGARERMPIENTDEWWTRITVRQKEFEENGFATKGMQFNISTSGAREEERNLLTAKEIIDELLQDISTDNRWSPELAKTVFELLIPNDFKEQLKKQNNINWIVDPHTASYPWELLQDEAVNAHPLAVNSGMIRQLSTQDYRININQVSEQTAFVLADPDLKGFLFQLPAARLEGELVGSVLSAAGFQVNTVNGTPGQIIKELFSKSYKIMHLAGHGVFHEDPSKNSGMLIGNDIYLSTKEICQMSTVPELVFVNCCYLGKMDGALEAYTTMRYRLAANIGTQLIRNGVKAVIVAGWAVDDQAAHDFTAVFYGELLGGCNFGEAVQAARKHIYDKYSGRNNTWGAYQCYGDPFYKLVPERKYGGSKKYRFIIAREAEIELGNLANRLELSGIGDEVHKDQLQAISEAVDQAGIRNGRITELEARIYAGLRDFDNSVAKYASLVNEENATFSFAALEQYCSVRLRQAIQAFRADSGKRAAGQDTARTVIRDLETLCGYSPTAERLNMIGGAYRRLALLSGDPEERIPAFERAAAYYFQAYERPNNPHKIHALCSWLNMENVLVLAGQRKWGAQAEGYKLWTLARIEKELNAQLEQLSLRPAAENYWDMIAAVNLKTSLYLSGKGSFSIEDIQQAYTQVWSNAGAKGKKMIEIELCDLMIDALQGLPAARAKKVATELSRLRVELVRLAG
ncbi:MAG: CHAT domain-containing protein [Chitinophagaceae bacterium]|nr:CHAT domain-containing protein [Chitinophagaceae bacterium]